MSPLVIALLTVVIIAASAFFVAAEFSLMAARRHRLEDAATTSRSARAALRSSAELTVLLAGCQLGITVCTLALGALTKPAVHHALMGPLAGLGLAGAVGDVVAFVLALVVVTFLHLVVGEMAPKSWAIAHPERAATMLALPMRAFITVTRPALRLLNGAANALVRRCGVDPDAADAGTTTAELRHLVEHSADVGTLDAPRAERLRAALEISDTTVADLVGTQRATAVAVGATAGDLRAATGRTGHLRVLVQDGTPARRAVGVVHVRDTLLLDDDAPLGPVTREVLRLRPSTTIGDALAAMRRTSTHLAVVERPGRPDGVVTLADVLGFVVPSHQGSTPA